MPRNMSFAMTTENEASREMTLEEWCKRLPKGHRVNRQLHALKGKDGLSTIGDQFWLETSEYMTPESLANRLCRKHEDTLFNLVIQLESKVNNPVFTERLFRYFSNLQSESCATSNNECQCGTCQGLKHDLD